MVFKGASDWKILLLLPRVDPKHHPRQGETQAAASKKVVVGATILS